MLTSTLYKTLRSRAGELELENSEMNYASRAYAKVAKEVAAPRELEAALLLKAAAKLQAVRDSWRDKPADRRTDLQEAVQYNRKLWTILIDALNRHDNKLPPLTRDNLLRLGVYILAESFTLMTAPKPQHLDGIIKINRGIAAGLRG
jgi:flagellar biosynthesis activator protein FlaF